MELLEQVQSTAALLMLFAGYILHNWDGTTEDSPTAPTDWTVFIIFSISCVIFFVTTLIRIWV